MAEQLRAILANDQQMQQLANSAFDHFDADHSGHVDKSELKQMLDEASAEFGFTAPTDGDLTEILQSLDADRNGRVTKDEFVPLIRRIIQGVIDRLEGN